VNIERSIGVIGPPRVRWPRQSHATMTSEREPPVMDQFNSAISMKAAAGVRSVAVNP